MLSTETLDRIRALATAAWQEQLGSFADWATNDQFAAAKDSGHAMAEAVDAVTVRALSKEFKILYELTAKGERVKRSMGDCWIRTEGVLHPLNIKSGEADDGSPNIVSLTRLAEGLLLRQIDSYYVLMVRISLREPRSASVVLFDLLDWLDYVVFNSGPGQLMLKQSALYAAMAAGVQPQSRTLQEKVDRLFEMREVGDMKLTANRAGRLISLRGEVEKYRQLPNYELDQKDLPVG